MNRADFEARVLDLWMKTRIPMTRAHIQYHSGVARKQVNKWLELMTKDGVLDCDVGDDGELAWRVPGAARPFDAPTSFAELERKRVLLDAARDKVRTHAAAKQAARDGVEERALVLARQAKGALVPSRGGALERRPGQALSTGERKKSLLASAGLSLLGPLGWFYAGSYTEAAIGTVALGLLFKILPTFLFSMLSPVLFPLSALAGLVYGWQYNRTGKRGSLFLGGKKKDEPGDKGK